MSKKITFLAVGAMLLLIASGYALYKNNQPVYEEASLLVNEVLNEEKTTELYGISLAGLELRTDEIKPNQNLSDLLVNYGVSYPRIMELAQSSRKIFDVRNLRPGRPYTLLLKTDSTTYATHFIYEINDVEYVVFDISGDSIYRQQKEVYTEKKVATGVIESSLYLTLQENEISSLLALKLADVYAWAIDFYRLQKGDKFRVIYNEDYVEGKSIGIEKIIAAVFTHMGEDYYAYYFEQNEESDYFDENANSLRKAFLKAPLKFSRISSRYSKKRFHPVLKTYKAHLGTDYAAPTGTPIMAVGDGVVQEAQYKRNNGNYVKIRHNSTYTTQYLHMSKIAGGVKPGARVRQGQVIGYVGSTGLATGPHLCYRFWKNGQQIDALKVKIPPSKPVDPANLARYKVEMAQMRDELDKIEGPRLEASL